MGLAALLTAATASHLEHEPVEVETESFFLANEISTVHNTAIFDHFQFLSREKMQNYSGSYAATQFFPTKRRGSSVSCLHRIL